MSGRMSSRSVSRASPTSRLRNGLANQSVCANGTADLSTFSRIDARARPPEISPRTECDTPIALPAEIRPDAIAHRVSLTRISEAVPPVLIAAGANSDVGD